MDGVKGKHVHVHIFSFVLFYIRITFISDFVIICIYRIILFRFYSFFCIRWFSLFRFVLAFNLSLFLLCARNHVSCGLTVTSIGTFIDKIIESISMCTIKQAIIRLANIDTDCLLHLFRCFLCNPDHCTLSGGLQLPKIIYYHQ